jgi:hypothetical protein
MPISYSQLRQAYQFAASSGVRCALLARHESLHADASFRDIDLIVAARDIPALSASLIGQYARAGYRLFNLIQNDYSEQLYFAGPGSILHIDLMPELSYRGIEFIELPLQEHQVQQIDGMRVVSEPWLVAYSLLRHLLWSGKIDERYRGILARMLNNPESGETLRNLLAGAVGRDCSGKLLEDIGDPVRLFKTARYASRSFLRRRFLRHPLTSGFGFFRHAVLLTRRFILYPGLVVVLLGSQADAVKAVAEGLEVALSEFGIMRPRLAASSGRRQSIGETKDLDFDSRAVSAPQRLYRVLKDYTPGFVKRLWRPLEIDHLLLLDQHSWDVTMNLLHSRYGRSRWMAQCIGYFIPKPGLWILLDDQREVAAPGEQQSRKTKQRIEALRSLVSAAEDHAIISAMQPTDEIVAEAYAAILDAYARRTQCRFKNRC